MIHVSKEIKNDKQNNERRIFSRTLESFEKKNQITELRF